MAMPSEASEAFIASLLESALAYADGGLPVFPLHSPLKKGVCDCPKHEECDSAAKHPRTMQGLKDAVTDEITVRRLWKMWPRANIAIAVPSGYVVLDVDGQEGMDALLVESEGEVLPDTPCVATGRGWHYWFRTETDLPPRAHMLTKVDLRGPGSYVVAPPSLHALATQYKWVRSLNDVEVQPIPAWLESLAMRSARSGHGGGDGGKFDTATVLAGVPEGRRDVELFRLASKLRYADVPYDSALELCSQAAANCQPPLDAQKAKEKVDSAYGRYMPSVNFETGEGKATLLSADSVRVELTSGNGPVEFIFTEMEKSGGDLNAEVSIQLLMPGTGGDLYIQRINMLSHSARDSMRRELENIFPFEKGVWAKLLNRAITESQQMYLGVDRSKKIRDIPAPSRVEYIVDGLVLEDRPTILFGAGSASKTIMCLSMLLAVSRGLPWQGRATQKRNCMIIDYESGEGTLGYRLNRLMGNSGEPVPENIHVWWADGIPLYDQVDAIKRSIEKNNIGFIVIDHCGAACGIEPEKAESALKFYRACNKIKIPILAIAHVTGEGEGNPDLVRRPFGSIYWSNGAGMTWYIRREDQEEESDVIVVGLFARKWNDSRRPKDFAMEVTFDGEEGPIEVNGMDMRESAQLVATRGIKYQIDNALVRPMSAGEISFATGVSEETCRKTLQRNSQMFEAITINDAGGRGQVQVWQKRERN
jgi:hypothetical protein